MYLPREKSNRPLVGGAAGSPHVAMAYTGSAYDVCRAHLTLVRAPECMPPPRITLPSDLHPLPDGVDAYMIYPFSVEDMVLSASRTPSSRDMAKQHERYAALLRERKEARERKHQEYLHRVAPGWSHGDHSILQPQRLGSSPSAVEAARFADGDVTEQTPKQEQSKSEATSPADTPAEHLADAMHSLHT